MRKAWVNRLGLIALVGGLCLADYGFGVTLAAAEPPIKESALPGITQNWDKNLPSASRFTVLTNFGGAAVRDNNTGLVWEQTIGAATHTWISAISHCINKNVGGTRGWRLPSVVELSSLIDPSLPSPYVPGSVFTGVQSDHYWSATTNANIPTGAWVVLFSTGFVGDATKTDSRLVWCVRGPMNADQF